MWFSLSFFFAGANNSRKIDKGDVDLRVANGARVAALAVGSNHLSLSSGLVLILNNCYYVPCLSKNIISISCLVEQGFEITINKSKGCSIYLDGIFYCSGMILMEFMFWIYKRKFIM